MARFDLTDFEGSVTQSLLPNKPRGVPRVGRPARAQRYLLSGAPWADIPELRSAYDLRQPLQPLAEGGSVGPASGRCIAGLRWRGLKLVRSLRVQRGFLLVRPHRWCRRRRLHLAHGQLHDGVDIVLCSEVDHLVGPETADKLVVLLPRCRAHPCPNRLRKLDRYCADALGTAVNENGLADGESGTVTKAPDRSSNEGEACGRHDVRG